nr:hypothetical protein CFP56_00324 [Quercus suber]
MATSIFASIFRRAPKGPAPNALAFPYTAQSNPYRCKRTWPPDFAQLSQKHQFRLERRFRRRTKLKWARPTWTKIVKLGQWGSILFVLVYGVLYLEIDERHRSAFDSIREWYWRQVEEIDKPLPNPIRGQEPRTIGDNEGDNQSISVPAQCYHRFDNSRDSLPVQ